MLELVDETFDHVALTVQVPINLTRFGSVRAWRDDRFRCLFFDRVEKVVRIITFVGDHGLRREAVN